MYFPRKGINSAHNTDKRIPPPLKLLYRTQGQSRTALTSSCLFQLCDMLVLSILGSISHRLCGLVVRVPGYGTEMYCVSCEVRTEFIYVM
jgi:hypothetical protein